MHVVYVGDYRLSWCTEVHIARTIEQLGHRVTKLQENAYTPATLTAELDRLQREDRPDLFLFTRTWGKTVTLDHLRSLDRAGIPTVSYHLDLYVPLPRGRHIATDPFWRTTAVYSADGDPRSAETFAKLGINHRHLLPAVVADECSIEDVPLEHDVIFVGSRSYHPEWQHRTQLLSWLPSTYGDRYAKYGDPDRVVRGDALNRLYASTRVAVGDSLVLERDGRRWEGYTSNRRYEAPGRGAFQIGPRIDGLNDGFEDGVNCVLYDIGDWAGLKDRIDHYLTADDERERLRRAGYEHVRDNHTFTHRLTKVFDELRRDGTIR